MRDHNTVTRDVSHHSHVGVFLSRAAHVPSVRISRRRVNSAESGNQREQRERRLDQKSVIDRANMPKTETRKRHRPSRSAFDDLVVNFCCAQPVDNVPMFLPHSHLPP